MTTGAKANVVQMAAQWRSARDACRGLPSWGEMMPQIKRLIQARADYNHESIASALEGVLGKVKGDAGSQMWLMAAAVEIMDPSE